MKKKREKDTLERVGTCDPNVVLKYQVTIRKIGRGLVDQVQHGIWPGQLVVIGLMYVLSTRPNVLL